MNPAHTVDWRTLLSAQIIALATIMPAAAQMQSGGLPTRSAATSSSPAEGETYNGGTPSESTTTSSDSSQSPFLSSVPEGKASAGVLQISFKDAIDRGTDVGKQMTQFLPFGASCGN